MNNLPPFPSGWFAVCFSKELKKGKILSTTFMGQEVVLFRANDNTPSALNAYCPHLGAHLGHGGKVIDGCIQCPFHHLKFDTNGQCSSAKHIKAKTWPLVEQDGFIFLYSGDPQKMHSFPHLKKEGWSPLTSFSMKIKTHPQETLENIVDMAHFRTLHKISHTKMVDLSTENVFTVHHKLGTQIPFLGKWGTTIMTNLSFYLFGLGFLFTKAHFPQLNTQMALLSSATPIDEHYLLLRVSFFIETAQPVSVIRKLLIQFVLRKTAKEVRHFFKQDSAIWEHKRYLLHPQLQSNESSISAFRKWAKKFYE